MIAAVEAAIASGNYVALLMVHRSLELLKNHAAAGIERGG